MPNALCSHWASLLRGKTFYCQPEFTDIRDKWKWPLQTHRVCVEFSVTWFMGFYKGATNLSVGKKRLTPKVLCHPREEWAPTKGCFSSAQDLTEAPTDKQPLIPPHAKALLSTNRASGLIGSTGVTSLHTSVLDLGSLPSRHIPGKMLSGQRQLEPPSTWRWSGLNYESWGTAVGVECMFEGWQRVLCLHCSHFS